MSSTGSSDSLVAVRDGAGSPAPTPHAVRQQHALPACVVGIGASAGGLDALERFFDNVPPNTGMAFVVVQHLSPDFRSMMDELLARHTDMPVRLVEDGMRAEPNNVYLIPPGKEMIVSGGRLLLSEREKPQELTLPIDVFFRSLAQDCGPRAVAIVLSGGGTDGSRGIRAVHEAGGLVIVQDGLSAQFDGMPRTARDAGVASWVLAPQDMPRVLAEHARTRTAPEAEKRRAPGGVGAIYTMLENEFGIDFTHYKPSTVTRRIERRLALARVEDVDRYLERLRTERDELDVLYRDLLIGVTRFFRNEEAFALLEKDVLPDLFRRAPKDAPFRVWVAGCATGEEAYSVAILVHEAAAKHGGRPVKIFATDVHRGSLERAARGVYDEDAVAHLPRERLETYFQRVGRTYQVVPDVRASVVFAHHNVIRDAPFTRVDLVTCRNMLIYFQPAAQQKVLSLFHFALRRGGVLFLGPSESPGPLSSDYEVLDKHWRVFRKFSDVRVPVEARPKPPPKASESRVAGPVAKGTFARYSLSQLLATYDALLEDFMPPSLLVSEQGQLVHAFGGASKFLESKDGRQGVDLVDLVEPELRMVLVGAMKRALATPSAIVVDGVMIGRGAERAAHTITVRRVANKNGGVRHVLVSFDGAKPRALPATHVDLGRVSHEQLGALEAELSSTKESLQAAIEELEASNEELQASNEELLASNEELQSTNEELQSVNEELYTVNAEHQRKISELMELTNDMDNLLSATDIGTIFLDDKLRIRKFTPQVAQTFDLVAHDVGRPIETFAHTLRYPELAQDLKRCLETGERIERELGGLSGKTFFLRVLPYRSKTTATGVVLTLIDVSGIRAAEDALFHERYLLDSLLASEPDAIYFKDVRGRFIRVNHAMAARLGLQDPHEAEGRAAADLMPEHELRAQAAADEVVIRSGEAQHYALERRLKTGEGEDSWDLATRLPLRDRDGNTVGVIGIQRDVTREKRSEEKIQEAMRRRDQFLAMLSHELRNPLGAMVTATRLLRADLGAAAATATATATATARYVETLERQSAQMARLLDDLLEASRVTQNKIELRRQVVDLRTVLRDAADAVRPLMDARGLDFALDAGPRPIHVDGDPARLQQINVNLLTNAAKYTPRGGHVRIRATKGAATAVVTVTDDGVGIPNDMLDSIFDLFVQSSRTLDRADGGLGVGLTLVRSLVEMHGGKAEARSAGPGAGSEFTVTLPLSDAVPLPEDVGRLSARARGPRSGDAKIVIVEDNDDSRQMLCAFLEQSGFSCGSAGTGTAGLELIKETRPAVALVDVGLPEIDGLEVARRVRSDPKNDGVYLVALTGYGQPSDRAAATEAGFDGHLVKPVDPDRLVEWLTRALRGRPEAPS